MTLLLEELPGKPDRNQPDSRVRIDSVCLVYGFKDKPVDQLNGKEAYVVSKAIAGPNGYFSPEDVHFEVAIRGMPTVFVMSINNLMHLDDSDDLIIEKMSD